MSLGESATIATNSANSCTFLQALGKILEDVDDLISDFSGLTEPIVQGCMTLATSADVRCPNIETTNEIVSSFPR